MSDYATVAELKARLWPAGTVDAQDDVPLASLLEAASRAIDERCGRRFYAASETRYFRAEFSDLLIVPDLLSVTTLQTDGDGDRVYESTWAATDYDLEPANAALDGKPYLRIVTAPNGNHTFPAGLRRGVKLTGSFGYAATPPARVHEACLLQAMRWYKRKDAVFGVLGSAELGQVQVIPRLDPDIAEMLRGLERGRGQIEAV